MPRCDTSILGSCEVSTRRSHNFPSILISTSLMAATAVVIYMYETTKLYDIAGYILLPVLVLMMYLASVIFWISLCVLVKTQPRSYRTTSPKEKSVINLVLIFLWILGLGAIFYSILNTIVYVQCSFEDLSTRKTHITNSAYRAIQAVFTIVQTIVLSSISKLNLRRTKLIQCFFVVILLTNTSAWIYNISIIQKPISLNSTHVFRCYWNTQTATKLISPIHPIMFAIEQEYNFLSVCVIVSLFFGKNWDTVNFNFTERQHRPSWKPSGRFVTYSIVSFIFQIPSVVIFVLRKTYNNQTLSNAWEQTTMFRNSTLLLIIWYGFHILRRMDRGSYRKNVEFDSFLDNDVVYIICASGTIMYAALGVAEHNHRGSFDEKAMKYSLFMIETFYQTIFLLYLKRFERKCYTKLYFVIIFLLFSNMITWIFFQFWIYDISYSNTNEVLGPLYPAARQTLYIFICFYRFQSFIYLFKFYKQEENIYQFFPTKSRCEKHKEKP